MFLSPPQDDDALHHNESDSFNITSAGPYSGDDIHPHPSDPIDEDLPASNASSPGHDMTDERTSTSDHDIFASRQQHIDDGRGMPS
jgi:hypothetical protein